MLQVYAVVTCLVGKRYLEHVSELVGFVVKYPTRSTC